MKSSEEDARKIEVVNGVDGSWTLFTDGNEIGKGTSTIDPTKKPRQIDFTITEGNGAGNKYHGIYETGDKTRKLCFGPAEKERPAKFASAMGSEHIFVVFERESKK